jgi:hypothetical protein
MLIAGLSEFFIIAGILFALKQRDRRQPTALAYGYVLCAFTVAMGLTFKHMDSNNYWFKSPAQS